MAISSINNSVGKTCTKFANSKFFKEKMIQNASEPAKFAASFLVLSIVSKDLVNCFLYTTQSLNNKKIPEEKRKFVAALDLMNGIIMVGGQFLVGKLIERKMTPKLFGKVFSGIYSNPDTKKDTVLNTNKSLHSDTIHGLTEKVAMEKAATEGIDISKVDLKALGKSAIAKVGKGSTKYGYIEAGFTILVTALATTAFVKRVLAPLFATPLAGWFKDKFMEKPGVKASTIDKVEPKKTDKEDKKVSPEELDAKLLDHSTAPWNHSNQDGDKAVAKKLAVKA